MVSAWHGANFHYQKSESIGERTTQLISPTAKAISGSYVVISRFHSYIGSQNIRILRHTCGLVPPCSGITCQTCGCGP